MTKKKVYYFVSLLLVSLPIVFYFFSLIHINETQFLLIIPTNFYDYFVSDNSFFFMSRLLNLMKLYDKGLMSSISIGIDLYIWFSVLFAISELFTFITDILNFWRKKE